MKRLTHYAISLAGAAVVATAIPQIAMATTFCNNSQGPDGAGVNFYSNYIYSGTGCITTKAASGAYSTSWKINRGGNYVAGRGWQVGSTTRTIGYNAGAFTQDGVNYLALYGWAKARTISSETDLVEYYVVESWGVWRPVGSTMVHKGEVTTDGATYDLYTSVRKNADNITGKARDFTQFWSVRRVKAGTGSMASNNTVTFRKHVAAWAKAGMNLPEIMDYQILATEAYGGQSASDALTGHSDATVWQQ